jgi:hypothetical protein
VLQGVAIFALLSLSAVTVAALEPLQGSPVVFELSFKAHATVPPKGALVLRPADGKGDLLRFPVVSGESTSVQLPTGSEWEVSPDLPGFWGARKPLLVGPPGQVTRLVLDLWPMGSISGIVRVEEKGKPLPRQVLVRTLAVPSFVRRVPAPKGALDCPVDERGHWSCSLPAASFDLVISAEGFIPHYRWSVPVPPGKDLSLGTLALQRGASVAGWVAVEGGALEPGACVARLSPLVAGGPDPAAALDVERKAAERGVGKDGFFQLTGLAPGAYALEVRQPGYSSVRIAPVRVAAQAETFLEEPLVLRRLLDLSLEISPALDWLGHPWKVQIFRQEENSGKPNPLAFEGSAQPDGGLVISGQPSGRFGITVLDSLGNRLADSQVSLDGPDSPAQRIEIDLITLEGTVRLGQEPLPARLWFGGRSGAMSLQMESDSEGRFQGVLPREGDWMVDVESAEPRLRSRTRLDVRANRAGKATAEIVLPDTRVFGTVVDPQGKPVPKADVFAMTERVELLETADAVGTFELRGLPEGAAWLTSSDDKRGSRRILVDLLDGRPVGPIELRLQATRKQSGRVVSPRGAVAGAQVAILASTPPEGGGFAQTDPDGSFEVEVPEATQRVVAIVAAPGFALKAFEAPVGAPLSLAVSEDRGDLEIRLAMKRDELVRRDLTVQVFQNGLSLLSNILHRWSLDQGEPWVEGAPAIRIPGLAPGEYRICLVPVRLPLEGHPASAGPECASGLLFRGETLALHLGG